MANVTNDPAAVYEALRASTAEMLKLDPANLSLVEGLQLDLIALLRLTTSDMQGAALSGEAVDLDRLSTALGMLQKLLPERSLVASAPTPEPRFGPNAREKLRELIARTVFGGDEEEAARLADACAREEATMAAEALGMPASSEGAVVAPVPSEGATTGSDALAASPAAQRETAEERMARVNRQMPPANYLRGRDEPWRDHIGADGNVIAGWFRPHG